MSAATLTVINDDKIGESLQDKVDRYIELTEFLAPYKAEHDKLKKELAAEANSVPSLEEHYLYGHGTELRFSASTQKTILLVTPEELHKMYGLSVFKPDLVKAKELEDLVVRGDIKNSKVKTFLKTHPSAFGWEWGTRSLLRKK